MFQKINHAIHAISNLAQYKIFIHIKVQDNCWSFLYLFWITPLRLFTIIEHQIGSCRSQFLMIFFLFFFSSFSYHFFSFSFFFYFSFMLYLFSLFLFFVSVLFLFLFSFLFFSLFFFFLSYLFFLSFFIGGDCRRGAPLSRGALGLSLSGSGPEGDKVL